MKPIVHDEAIRVRVPAKTLEEFKQYAHCVEERTMSSIIRRMIKELLAADDSKST